MEKAQEQTEDNLNHLIFQTEWLSLVFDHKPHSVRSGNIV